MDRALLGWEDMRLVATWLAGVLVSTCGLGGGDPETPSASEPQPAESTTPVPGPMAEAGPPPPPAHGLRSDWFDLFADKTDTRFDVAASIAHDESTAPAKGVRGILYSARFSGFVTVAQAGDLTLFAKSDDGVRVFVDDKPVIDHWAAHSAIEDSGKATVTAGEHALRIEYYQLRGAAALALEWQPPGGTRAAIPTEALRPATDAPADGPRPTFSNPVIPFDCPDPGVMSVPGPHPRWVMACTGGKMRIRVSDDLVTWQDSQGYILPSGKAPWSANGGRNWAPEIHRVGTSWVAYFTAVDGANRLSIGCAYASAPEGPYTDCGGPLVQDPLGVIDATEFEDADGKKYLYYKIDGNSQGKPTPIFVRELAADGRSFAPGGAPTQVLVNDPSTWEGGVVEAPWVVLHDGTYYLFYSGNGYDARYRTGVARAKSPKGPFTKKGPPVMGNNARWVGPGHGSILNVHGRDWYFHHAWPALADGSNDGSKGRWDLLEPIKWAADGWPVVGDGSSVTTPMAWP